MLRNTFLFIPGIGKKTEEKIWKKNILTWNDLEKSLNLVGINGRKRRIIKNYLEYAREALEKKDIKFFSENLPEDEHWRLYKEFHDKTLFLDIESTGLSQYYDTITIIGTSNGKKYDIFIKDINLDEITNYIENYDIIVTFNGKIFDIPFIKNELSNFKNPPVHIDLRYFLKKLGYSGPLKKIEDEIGLGREKNIKDMDGKDAAILWNRFLNNDDSSFKDLITYNIYDVMNLKNLMEFLYQKKLEKEILSKINNNQKKLKSTSIKPKIKYSHPEIEAVSPNVKIQKINGKFMVNIDNKTIHVDKNRIKRPTINIEGLIQRIKDRRYNPVSVGIDLTGSEEKASGFCILHGKYAYFDLLDTNEKLIHKTTKAEPSVISIDSPLSIPKNRCCPEDSCKCRKYGITRECERILKRRGINVYPCLIKSMQKLTMRGIKLTEIFEGNDYEVIESYPGAAQDILRFPRKRINLEELEKNLVDIGIQCVTDREKITHDEIDALTSALVGYFYLAGEFEAVGNVEEGYLIIPDLNEREGPHGGKLNEYSSSDRRTIWRRRERKNNIPFMPKIQF